MTLSTYLLHLVAVLLLTLTPGPTMLMTLRWINRVCGSLFAFLGGVLLFARRHS